jgi:tripartite-type tricarboxylate transporter receptor subunit TctC
MRQSRIFTLALCVLCLPLRAEAAESPYFQGKTITLQVGSGPGGRQDRIARTIAKYLTKYVPGNPVFVIQNRSGGQGIPAMMNLSKGPSDGSFMSMVISAFLEAPYFGAPGANYDPRSSSTPARPAPASSATCCSSTGAPESRRSTI